MSGSLLSILLDVNQINWNKISASTEHTQSMYPGSHPAPKARFTLDEILDGICVAMNIHFAMDPANEILFYIYDSEVKYT